MRESEESIIEGLPFIRTFRAFDRVVSKCFGVELQPDYEVAIQQFKIAYLGLGISVTPKVFLIYLNNIFFQNIFAGPLSLPAH